MSAETISSFFGDGSRPGDPAPAVDPSLTPDQTALITEVCGKSKVCWVRPADDRRDRLAWHVWLDGALLLVYGDGEQSLPRLDGVTVVSARSKDSGARLIRFLARAQVLAPRSPEWEAAADALAAARLNDQDVAGQRERWASTATISRLVPFRMVESGPGDDTTPPGAVQPDVSAAATIGWRPWHLGGRPQRRRGTVHPPE